MSRSFNRSSKNTKRTCAVPSGKRLLSLMTAGASLTAAFLAAPAHAAGYAYQQHVLNAGVLVNGSDPAPYLFYVMNNRPDVRPTDLTLINPLAPASATPNTPAYWEVSLNSISDSEMAQYNVLYLRADGISFGPVINEKLRRFVSNGGQLIVEYGGAAAALGLFTGTGATSGGGTNVSLPPVSTAFLRQPIVSQPYLLSLSDLNAFTTPIPPATVNPVQYALTPNTADVLHASEYSNIFSPALTATNGTVVSTAQMGAGQVVASTLNIGAGITVDPGYKNANGAFQFNPANLYLASTSDLKLLANILAWSEAHPTENKTSYGNASNNGLASFSPAWQYQPPSPMPVAPPAAAVWGNFVFAVDSSGTLSAFDAYPAESLLAGPNIVAPDDGIADYSLGKSYDALWQQSLAAGVSAPTLASINGTNYVFVEKANGSLAAFNAVTGAAAPFTLTQPTPASGSAISYPQGQNVNAPAPTFYDGRIYAGQANGTLHVYDLTEGTSAVVTLDSNQSVSSSAEYVTGAPSVGTVTSGDTSVLVAVVPTNYNIYSVLLGARDEALKAFDQNGTLVGYSINRLGHYDLGNIFADLSSLVPPLDAYDYNGTIASTTPTSTAPPTPQDPLFPITLNNGYYTDWNMDFASAAGVGVTPSPVNLNFISANSQGELKNNSTPTAADALSAPAIDRHGNYYYTETMAANSYVVGVSNAPLRTSVHIKFRFRMPTTADASAWGPNPYVDADQVNYTPLIGFHFVGAPVVDDQGNVYVAAVNGPVGGTATLATVLCFRGDQQVVAVPPPPPAGSSVIDLITATITQIDEGGGGEANDIRRGPDAGVGTANANYGQYLASAPVMDVNGNITSPGSISFYNFGLQGKTPGQIVGDVTEPQPVIAASSDGTGTTMLNMQTNLAWYVQPFTLTPAQSSANAGSIQGLSLVGSSVYLCDGTSLYRLTTKPQVSTVNITSGTQTVTSSKVATNPPSVSPIGAGLVGAPPSIGGSVMVINGAVGLAARTRQVTVIADSGRVLGVDGNGSAVWSVDGTTRTDLTASPAVSTRVPFSHPTSLSSFGPNDYLAADPGTNRCVRFDPGGNVQWELTRFTDPYGLMALGQPVTLSQPASVETRMVADTDPNNLGGSYTYYLVADSGNSRIVEVCDRLNSGGGIFTNPNAVANEVILNHALTWVSHTGDQGGRNYRYGSAAYYQNTQTPSGLSIAATVTNTRLAPLVANPTTGVVTGLGPVSGDAPGGSIVVFNYPKTLTPFSSLSLPSVPVDLVYTTAGFYTTQGSGTSATYTPFTIRNPRFLQFVSSPAASAPVDSNSNPQNPNNIPAFNFLYADDNGAFDLTYDTNKGAFVAGPGRLQFKTADYQTMSYPAVGPNGMFASVPVPAFGVTDTVTAGNNMNNLRAALPFIPTCVQALSTDTQSSGNSGTQTTRRYLITQNYSQGELGSANAVTTGTGTGAVTATTGKLGGEVFEVDVTASSSGSGTSAVTTPGGFAGSETLSHPALTGPLTQPTYAVRLP